MIGDLMHSPVQCAEPDWHAGSDLDPALARQSRRRFLEWAVETRAPGADGAFPVALHRPHQAAGRRLPLRL